MEHDVEVAEENVAHIYVVGGLEEVLGTLLHELRSVVDQWVDEANCDSPHIVLITNREDSSVHLTVLMQKIFIYLHDFYECNCILHQKGVIDIHNKHNDVNDMNKAAEQMLFLCESVPFVVDHVFYHICLKNSEFLGACYCLNESTILF